MRKTLALVAATMLFVPMLAPPAQSTAVEPQSEESRMMQLVNLERSSLKLSTLKVDKRLIYVARDHCIEMWFKEYFSHISPTPELRTPTDRYMREFGKPSYLMIGENLYWAARPKTMLEAHKALMGSPEHKENIVNPRWTTIGAGFFETPEHQIYVTVIFVTTEPPK